MATIDETYKKDLAFKSNFVVTASGDLDTLTGLDNYKDALYRRLITTPGSLIHRPNYGVGIKSFLNTISTLETKQRLAKTIKQQYEEDPRTESVSSVEITADDYTPELTKINIKVRAVGYGDVQFEFIPFGGI